MLFLPLPLRAKNPPDHRPWVTVLLIVINVLVYLLTSEYGLFIHKSAIERFALSHDTFSPLRMLTSMFLHAHPAHIGSNMLMLWILGASVEGRLGWWRYLSLYLMSGAAGCLLHDHVSGFDNPEVFSLGASGAVMGVSGAYLYLFPFSTIVVGYLLWLLVIIRAGTFEVQARWVLLVYVGLDLLNAILSTQDGIGHFIHLGGAGMGLLLAIAFQGRRDTEEVSEVQAVRAELKDYTLLNLSELETLAEQPTQDMVLVLAYLEKAVNAYGGNHSAHALNILNRHAHELMSCGDPNRLAHVLIWLPVEAGGMPPVYYLRLASRLEQVGEPASAARLYRRVYDLYPTATDTETALFRLGQLMLNVLGDRAYAKAVFEEQLRLFPHGPMSLSARRLLTHGSL